MDLGGIDQPSAVYFVYRPIPENKWKYNNEECQLFVNFEKEYYSIKTESWYDILIKFGIQIKKDLHLSRHI